MGDDLRKNLKQMNYHAGDNNLADLMRIIGLQSDNLKKEEVVEILYAFYSNSNSAPELFDQLNDYEKALLTSFVQHEYHFSREELQKIAKQYEVNVDQHSQQGYRNTFFPTDSKLHAFFVNGEVPKLFRDYLEQVIPPYVLSFHPSIVEDIDKYAAIIGRESRYKDFDKFLSFINTNKVTATKSRGYLTKSSLLKFYNIAGFDEICNSESGGLGDIHNCGDAIVSFGMIMLLRAADIIDIVDEKFVFSKNASHFVGLSMPKKAKFLFTKYLRDDNHIIDECSRISSARLKFFRKKYDLSWTRSKIVSYLKKCPVNEWISFDDFSKGIYRDNWNLFEMVGEVFFCDNFYTICEPAPWNCFEHCAISVILMEYLAVLGAVDILAEDTSHSDYEYYSAYETTYFRVTDLGAYLFGITDSYQEKEGTSFSDDEKGFIVQPNFDVVISNSRERMRHELFFDQFAQKTVDDKEVSVYKLNFSGMAKALSIGLMIHEICTYCEVYSNVPLPDNVMSAFLEWEEQSKRIRIRDVTVIETDDNLLLEEIVHYSGMKAISEGKISSFLVLNPSSIMKAKSIIEKNNRFCVLEKWKYD